MFNLELTKIELRNLIMEKCQYRYGLPNDWQLTYNEYDQIKKHLSKERYLFDLEGNKKQCLSSMDVDSFAFWIRIDYMTKKPIFSGYTVYGRYYFNNSHDALSFIKHYLRLPQNADLIWGDVEDTLEFAQGNWKF